MILSWKKEEKIKFKMCIIQGRVMAKWNKKRGLPAKMEV